MKVSEIMSKTLIKTSVESTVACAARIMDTKNIGAILVENEGVVVGIMTERDILRKIVSKGADPGKTTVEEVMVSPITTISADKTVEEASEFMNENNIRRLPVECDGKIVGIVSIRDISGGMRYSLGKSLRSGCNYYRPSYGRPI